MRYPKKIQIGFQEGTCPLKCKKCFAFGENAKAIKKVQKMPREKAKQLIDKISELDKIPSIQPSIYTEPFANEDLKELIPYCRDRNIPINIITNGVLLDKEWMDLLIRYLDTDSIISFSLDAVNQATYEKVRGAYSLADLEKKIEYLMNNRGSHGLRVSVNFVYEEDNYNEQDAFLMKWKNIVDAVRISVAIDSDRKIPFIYRKGDSVKKCDVCPYLQETMTIDAGGEVRFCSVDAFGESYLGNVFEEEIMTIWNGKKMEELREKHRENRLTQNDFCYGCEGGYSMYNFSRVEENDDFTLKISDYAVYYNRRNRSV